MKTIQQLLKIQAMLLCAALTVVSCADDSLTDDKDEGDKGTAVSFHVSSAQDEMLLQQQTAPATRSAVLSRLGDEGLTLEDLATRKHAVQGAADLCMIETTIEGVNPVLPSADTRAQVKANIDNFFTTSGYRSDTPGFAPDTPDWFYAVKTKNDGTLTTYHPWHWGYRYGRFYAVYPEAKSENKITLSPATHSGTPYVEFEAEQDVKNQKDLMTACSGEVKYETRGIAPTTNLKFRHALTAVRFAVGQNLSWNKRITKVEIKNACSKGKYMLPTQYGGAGTWVAGSLTDRKNFVLDVAASPIDLKKNPNTVIMGNPSDNYTFYMIPQDLTGVTVVITLESTYPGSTAPNTITIPLTGKKAWKPGTSKLYKLSQNTSDWTYSLTVTKQPAAAAFNQGTSDTYGITSMRTAPDGTQQAAAWKVKEYSFDNGATWVKTIPANSWFKGLSLKEGGSNPNVVGEEQGSVTLKNDDVIVDHLAERNIKLKQNPHGIPTNYYDLSMYDVKGNLRASRNTANCYVISHPGYYKIPLVYGNAIKNGANNTNAYQTSQTGTYILKRFKDHNNNDITDPWIEKTNGGANSGINDARIVWADEANLVTFSASKIVRNGSETFLQFEVKEENIKNANAVIAVLKDNNVVWSWHLWFAPEDVLNTITCTNFEGKNYAFTQETLGTKYTTWNGTTYSTPRNVMVKVMQEKGQGSPMISQEAVFTITQNPGNMRQFYPTFYQWGRKDAFPGTENVLQGSFNKNAGDNMSIQNGILHPENFYTDGPSWYSNPPIGYSYSNLWSANYNIQIYNRDAIKTIYDPCPVGFKIPEQNAFTGFSKTGNSIYSFSQKININALGAWDDGFYFNNKITSPNAAIYFPAFEGRRFNDGSLSSYFVGGAYWSRFPNSNKMSSAFTFDNYGNLILSNSRDKSFGFSVRPVADE